MEPIELRIVLTEDMIRDLLWRALAPEALVMTGAINQAIAQQQVQLGVSLDQYRLTGISITTTAGMVYAELSYTPVGR